MFRNGCRPADTSGVLVDNDITYATYGTRELKLDLYRPASGSGPFPGIVFIHGGRWELGDKTEFSRQAAVSCNQGLCERQYRLSFFPGSAVPCCRL